MALNGFQLWRAEGGRKALAFAAGLSLAVPTIAASTIGAAAPPAVAAPVLWHSAASLTTSLTLMTVATAVEALPAPPAAAALTTVLHD
ncbi:hypothetical protein Ctob_003112 [Chrysochromulina tobinii]|uniref:Uncharacterized protein n=1 Tax=Chrysochromulina tobinii TaxID=1460289 RepID=A0A0M0JDI0_9EUKA|nr:hypothetical protein Ctob_003112 [Chrysochromulina tobinii]|eukprot:KOO24288.1 hypothetical protein Ctob_003112 [Chrysochromulina sp. CCMP291]